MAQDHMNGALTFVILLADIYSLTKVAAGNIHICKNEMNNS